MFHVKPSALTYLDVPRETFTNTRQLTEKWRPELEDYIEQLLWWNKRINLVSRNVSRETIWQHVRHSLLLSQFEAYISSSLILDSGTGGGLPGLPLAIISPGKRFVLNDIVGKKVLALKQMIKKLGLQNISTADCSVEAIDIQPPFLLVSKHAFKINDLYAMVAEKNWTQLIFYKGLPFEEELEGLPPPLRVITHKLSGVTDDSFYRDKVLVSVSRD